MFVQDAGLICQPTASVRNADTKGNPALNGKTISAHVKVFIAYFGSSLPSHKDTDQEWTAQKCLCSIIIKDNVRCAKASYAPATYFTAEIRADDRQG